MMNLTVVQTEMSRSSKGDDSIDTLTDALTKIVTSLRLFKH